jgi:hypothetical protein
MAYTKRISYDKTFTTSYLAGITRHETLDTTDDAVDFRVARLQRMTRETPGTEVITNACFVVSNIVVKDIAADKHCNA